MGEEQRQRLLSLARFGSGGIEADLILVPKKYRRFKPYTSGSLCLDFLGFLQFNLRIKNYWFMDGILKHSDFQLRLPSKIECQLILEALNEASKECTYKHVNCMNCIDLNFCLVNQPTPLTI